MSPAFESDLAGDFFHCYGDFFRCYGRILPLLFLFIQAVKYRDKLLNCRLFWWVNGPKTRFQPLFFRHNSGKQRGARKKRAVRLITLI